MGTGAKGMEHDVRHGAGHALVESPQEGAAGAGCAEAALGRDPAGVLAAPAPFRHILDAQPHWLAWCRGVVCDGLIQLITDRAASAPGHLTRQYGRGVPLQLGAIDPLGVLGVQEAACWNTRFERAPLIGAAAAARHSVAVVCSPDALPASHWSHPRLKSA